VWTEAALQARAQAGNLDPAELATASTKLAGWGYSFTTPSIETLLRAGSPARPTLLMYSIHSCARLTAVCSYQTVFQNSFCG